MDFGDYVALSVGGPVGFVTEVHGGNVCVMWPGQMLSTEVADDLWRVTFWWRNYELVDLTWLPPRSAD